MGIKFPCGWSCRYWVLTRLRRNVSYFIDPMANCELVRLAAIAGASDRYQRFSVLWSLSYRRSSPGHPLVSCREAKRRANVEANDQRACSWHVQLSTPSQLTAGDLFVHWVQTKFGLNVPYYGGVWYIHDWVRVMWLIVLTHRAWNWRNLEYSFAVRHQFSHPYKQIDKIRLFKY